MTKPEHPEGICECDHDGEDHVEVHRGDGFAFPCTACPQGNPCEDFHPRESDYGVAP